MTLRIVLMGPPGSGKGTQSEKLSHALNIPVIAVGDILRDESSKSTKMAEKQKAYIKKGLLVPDKIIIELIEKYISKYTETGYILDGFPRTLVQAKALDRIIAENGTKKSVEFYFLNVGLDFIIDRISGRLFCETCHAIYHRKFNPSKRKGKCDLCRAELKTRDDDSLDVLQERYMVYQYTFKKVKNYFSDRIIKINAECVASKVYLQIVAQLGLNIS